MSLPFLYTVNPPGAAPAFFEGVENGLAAGASTASFWRGGWALTTVGSGVGIACGVVAISCSGEVAIAWSPARLAVLCRPTRPTIQPNSKASITTMPIRIPVQ
jgi:hypothetical protein